LGSERSGLLGVAIIGLAVTAFTAGWFVGRSGAADTALGQRVAVLEARLGTPAKAVAAEPAAAPAPGPRAQLAIGSAPTRGPSDAPVTVVEFSDFQCPYCARVHPTMVKLLEEFPDQVQIAFKHYPLPNHPKAPLAHRAAIAAGQQDRFWEMHDLIFENQRALEREDLIAHAETLGLDLASFEVALDDEALGAQIEADIREGSEAGVRGTPAFFVNGRLLSGAQPYAAFKAAVEGALEEVGG
jgi:protein-disulfide isomerase